MRVWFVAVAVAMGLSSPASAQDEWVVAEPSSAWEMHYGDDSCALRRQFSANDEDYFLELTEFAPLTPLRIRIVGPDMDIGNEAPQFRFGEAGDFRSARLPSYGRYDQNREGLVFHARLRSDEAMRRQLSDNRESLSFSDNYRRFGVAEADVSGLYLEDVFDRPIILRTGAMSAPMAAMRTCIEALVATWDSTGFFDQAGVVPPRPVDQERWAGFIQRRFPSAFLHYEEPVRAAFILLIDDQGKPKGCRLIEPFLGGSHEETICDHVLREARYSPAVGADGQMVSSFTALFLVYGRQRQ